MGKHEQRDERDEQWLGEELLARQDKLDPENRGKHRQTDPPTEGSN